MAKIPQNNITPSEQGTSRSILNTKQPRIRKNDKLQKKVKAGSFTLSPAELVELRLRQDSLLLRLDKAVFEQDIPSIYWINVEIQTICHIYGLPSPLGSSVGVEVLRGLREIRSLAIPDSYTDSAGGMKAILTAALYEAAKRDEAQQIAADKDKIYISAIDAEVIEDANFLPGCSGAAFEELVSGVEEDD